MSGRRPIPTLSRSGGTNIHTTTAAASSSLASTEFSVNNSRSPSPSPLPNNNNNAPAHVVRTASTKQLVPPVVPQSHSKKGQLHRTDAKTKISSSENAHSKLEFMHRSIQTSRNLHGDNVVEDQFDSDDAKSNTTSSSKSGGFGLRRFFNRVVSKTVGDSSPPPRHRRQLSNKFGSSSRTGDDDSSSYNEEKELADKIPNDEILDQMFEQMMEDMAFTPAVKDVMRSFDRRKKWTVICQNQYQNKIVSLPCEVWFRKLTFGLMLLAKL
jgi:hypothetical protein